MFLFSIVHSYNNSILFSEMGIKCIRTERVIVPEEPVFLYQNMIMKKTSNPRDQYQFLQKIGKGSFSQVFRAKNFLTGNIRAIKQIQCRNNPKLLQLIINEFNILRKLDHPNIMKMYEYFQDNNYIYIAAELCPGRQFFDFIVESKNIPEKKARTIFYDLACAVRYMHDNHFMHRDLKPENILYDPETGSLKVVDLGSGLQFDSDACLERKRVGTSYYIAPEVLARCYNQKCDIWSMGVILYIMLSGEPPFKGKDDPTILQNVKTAPLDFKKSIWMKISEKAKHLLKNMLNRDIKKRYSIEEVLEDGWFDAVVLEKQGSMISEEEQKSMVSCLSNLKNYKDMKKQSLQEGIITFIVNFVRNNEDAVELQQSFKNLDLNGDGVLSEEELSIGMMKFLNVKQREADAIAEAVFRKVDTNHSGYIDYSQFVIAASNFQLTISEQNLDIAFDYLDSDHSGKISAAELKQKLGNNIQEETYKEMMKNFDKNSDGEISKEQFRQMMKTIISKG